MLSQEQLRHEQAYSTRNGMVNVCWVAGMARRVQDSPGSGFIQQTNNLNQMIPWEIQQQDRLPQHVREGVNIKVVGRLHSGTNTKGDHQVRVVALAFPPPDYRDLPPLEAWQAELRAGIPRDKLRPPEYGPSEAQVAAGEESLRLKNYRVSDTGNMVKMAGFIAGYFHEPKGPPKADGGRNNGQLTILLRQSASPDDLIPVVIRSNNVADYARGIQLGFPCYVVGWLEMILKNAGPASDDGADIPVISRLMIRSNALKAPGIREIGHHPDWAKALAEEGVSKRAKAREKTAPESMVADGSAAAASSVSAMQVPPELLQGLTGTAGRAPATAEH